MFTITIEQCESLMKQLNLSAKFFTVILKCIYVGKELCDWFQLSKCCKPYSIFVSKIDVFLRWGEETNGLKSIIHHIAEL